MKFLDHSISKFNRKRPNDDTPIGDSRKRVMQEGSNGIPRNTEMATCSSEEAIVPGGDRCNNQPGRDTQPTSEETSPTTVHSGRESHEQNQQFPEGNNSDDLHECADTMATENPRFYENNLDLLEAGKTGEAEFLGHLRPVDAHTRHPSYTSLALMSPTAASHASTDRDNASNLTPATVSGSSNISASQIETDISEQINEPSVLHQSSAQHVKTNTQILEPNERRDVPLNVVDFNPPPDIYFTRELTNFMLPVSPGHSTSFGFDSSLLEHENTNFMDLFDQPSLVGFLNNDYTTTNDDDIASTLFDS